MASSTGQCLCGAVRFKAENAERHHHACHCGMCRRWSGGPVFAAPVASVSFQGEVHIGRFDSSEWAQRGFCRQCGSHLFYYLKHAKQYSICVGAFDEAAAFRLEREIFVDHKPPGYAFAGQLEKLTEEQVFAAHTQS
jgi:hypothetical protein